jgi:hypothetical protein
MYFVLRTPYSPIFTQHNKHQKERAVCLLYYSITFSTAQSIRILAQLDFIFRLGKKESGKKILLFMAFAYDSSNSSLAVPQYLDETTPFEDTD